MTKVDGNAALLSALRAQLGLKGGMARSGTAARAGVAAEATAAAPSTAASTAASLDLAAARLGRALQPLSLATTTGRRHARRLFIESALTGEWGDALLLDPGVDDLIRRTEDSLSASDELAESLDRLLQRLQTQGRG